MCVVVTWVDLVEQCRREHSPCWTLPSFAVDNDFIINKKSFADERGFASK
jgi:hypothetical protein